MFDPLDGERESPGGHRVEVAGAHPLARRERAREGHPGRRARPTRKASNGPRVVGVVVDDVHEIDLHEDPPEMAYYPLPGGHGRRRRACRHALYVVCARTERGGAVGRGARGGARARSHPADCRVRGRWRTLVGARARRAGVRHGPACDRRRTRAAARRGRALRGWSRTWSRSAGARSRSGWPWGRRWPTCAGWC